MLLSRITKQQKKKKLMAIGSETLAAIVLIWTHTELEKQRPRLRGGKEKEKFCSVLH